MENRNDDIEFWSHLEGGKKLTKTSNSFIFYVKKIKKFV